MDNKNVVTNENGVLIKDAANFDPDKIFTCGQCFRWLPAHGAGFRGVVNGRVLCVSKIGNDILIEGTDMDDYEKYWHKYFDMDRDYSRIIKSFSDDPVLSRAAEHGSGIRILKQDFFECVLSFIISANNNIPRIQGIIERLCRMFGRKITVSGTDYYAFPSPFDMQDVTEDMLAPIRCGYRAKYIVNAVRAFLDGEIDADYIASLPYEKAKQALCKISGVGPKVADCIMLFSLGRFDVFPTDVWVKRVMHELYECSENEAAAFGRQLYGNFAGIAQQYLFFWRRNVKEDYFGSSSLKNCSQEGENLLQIQ